MQICTLFTIMVLSVLMMGDQVVHAGGDNCLCRDDVFLPFYNGKCCPTEHCLRRKSTGARFCCRDLHRPCSSDEDCCEKTCRNSRCQSNNEFWNSLIEQLKVSG
uniref:Uncharacterized protein n=1 Tax=Trichobilharzia regenti TaxID=157069 RepID=A0AA85J4S0_TRIRE|nr:unnamed protein product [Trichobilharzia regenti]